MEGEIPLNHLKDLKSIPRHVKLNLNQVLRLRLTWHVAWCFTILLIDKNDAICRIRLSAQVYENKKHHHKLSCTILLIIVHLVSWLYFMNFNSVLGVTIVFFMIRLYLLCNSRLFVEELQFYCT